MSLIKKVGYVGYTAGVCLLLTFIALIMVPGLGLVFTYTCAEEAWRDYV